MTPGDVANGRIEGGGGGDQGRVGEATGGERPRVRARRAGRGRRAGAKRSDRQGRRRSGAAPSVERALNLVVFPVSAA
jgi:hypothetical protein